MRQEQGASKKADGFSRSDLVLAYRLRWKRRRLLYRSWRRRKELSKGVVRDIPANGVLVFSTMRNEMTRLPFWLHHYRAMGASHFLIVDNGSDDGTAAYLAEQEDVSLWTTQHSYKASRFGVDWLTNLHRKYGPGRWCLTVDADELLVYPDHDRRSLQDLTRTLEASGADSFGAMMLDLYPDGPLSQSKYMPGDDPTESIPFFDAEGYTWELKPQRSLISIRGGVRKRVFFEEAPDHAPHLHKIPLVKWKRGFAYLSSAHDLLPRRLNTAFDARRGLPTGVLLHTKFLDEIIEKSAQEKLRDEHFTHSARYDGYYDAIVSDPVLMGPSSVRYSGWQQLEQLGLMTLGNKRN